MLFVFRPGFRSWLTRWFGRNGVNKQEHDNPAGSTPGPGSAQGPLFSLGDTKQDVVVSYRGGHAEES